MMVRILLQILVNQVKECKHWQKYFFKMPLTMIAIVQQEAEEKKQQMRGKRKDKIDWDKSLTPFPISTSLKTTPVSKIWEII